MAEVIYPGDTEGDRRAFFSKGRGGAGLPHLRVEKQFMATRTITPELALNCGEFNCRTGPAADETCQYFFEHGGEFFCALFVDSEWGPTRLNQGCKEAAGFAPERLSFCLEAENPSWPPLKRRV